MTGKKSGGGRILFVAGEAAISGVAEPVLGLLGYRVSFFTSSGRALAVFSGAPDDFDLLITDQDMNEELTGLDLIRLAWRLRLDLPVILLAASIEALNRNNGIAIGVNAVLAKPCSIPTLVAAIRRVLAEKNAGGVNHPVLSAEPPA